ncbi:membrane protein [Vibrio alfacsensis]|uniref:MAPEG family protein n=1 Tax=Vibrio alfacsensis TaxID=1074311 RepID=UPI001BF0B0E5|nr:MAPEG family protein [Vibrio alfacsensis]BBM66593.1 membrane protein [Vibrio alfacsensis]
MITALYACVLALLLIWLAFQVIKQRRINKVAYADGGVEPLQIARSAQSNAAEYIPITLILMCLLEYNGASVWWVHMTGLLFVVGRVLHARAILSNQLKGRVTGMKLTFASMLTLVILNLFYLPYGNLW